MASPDAAVATTRVTRRIHATPGEIYRAIVDPDMVAAWLPPANMRGIVHEFEPREGGRLRLSLVYQDPSEGPGGKTTADTDTFRGRIVELVPEARVVWLVAFESDQPGISGEMRVTWALAPAGDGTDVSAICEGIPPGIRPEDNEEGSRSSLAKLARLVESKRSRGSL